MSAIIPGIMYGSGPGSYHMIPSRRQHNVRGAIAASILNDHADVAWHVRDAFRDGLRMGSRRRFGGRRPFFRRSYGFGGYRRRSFSGFRRRRFFGGNRGFGRSYSNMNFRGYGMYNGSRRFYGRSYSRIPRYSRGFFPTYRRRY